MRKVILALLFFCILFSELYSQPYDSRRSPSYRYGKSRRSQTADGPKPPRRETDKPPRREMDKPPRREIDKLPRREMDKPPRREMDKLPRREMDKPPRRETDKPPRREMDKPLRRRAPLKNEQMVNWDELLKNKEIRLHEETGLKNKPFTSNKKFEVKNELDLVFLKSLQDENRNPSPLCSDEVFLRRVYLDLIGRIPTAKEARTFLEDKNTEKRKKLIDTLLDSNEFTDLQTMRWCDLLRVKSEFPINLWPNGAACYYRWIHQSVEDNKPYSQFARDLITANGSNFRDGASNFYRSASAKDSDTLAEMVSRTFMDIDIAPWPKEKRNQVAFFFSRVGYKETAQWKEEIVFWNKKPLDRTEIVFPDSTVKQITTYDDPRKLFADWLISPANTIFNVCAVNRIWSWLFGQRLSYDLQGIQNDHRSIHPKLTHTLCQELIKSKYDLKHMYRLILNSGIYQQISIPQNKDQDETEYFTTFPILRIEAEIFQDMLTQIFDLPVKYTSEIAEPFTNIPPQYRTILLPDASITSSFLEMFGRSSRDTGTETDRNNEVTESQQLFLLNSTEINEWIVQYTNHLKFNPNPDNLKDLFDEIWLTFLSRFPTQEEYNTISRELSHSSYPFTENR